MIKPHGMKYKICLLCEFLVKMYFFMNNFLKFMHMEHYIRREKFKIMLTIHVKVLKLKLE